MNSLPKGSDKSQVICKALNYTWQNAWQGTEKFCCIWKYASFCFPALLLLRKYPANPDLQMSKAAVWQRWTLTYCSCNIWSCESCEGFHTCCAMGLLCWSMETVSESQNLAPGCTGWPEDLTGDAVNSGIPWVLGDAELVVGNMQTTWKHRSRMAQNCRVNF